MSRTVQRVVVGLVWLAALASGAALPVSLPDGTPCDGRAVVVAFRDSPACRSVGLRLLLVWTVVTTLVLVAVVAAVRYGSRAMTRYATTRGQE